MDFSVALFGRNTFLRLPWKSDLFFFSDEPRQSQLKTFWRGLSIIDAIKKIMINGDWDKLVLSLTDDSEGLRSPWRK